MISSNSICYCRSAYSLSRLRGRRKLKSPDGRPIISYKETREFGWFHHLLLSIELWYAMTLNQSFVPNTQYFAHTSWTGVSVDQNSQHLIVCDKTQLLHHFDNNWECPMRVILVVVGRISFQVLTAFTIEAKILSSPLVPSSSVKRNSGHFHFIINASLNWGPECFIFSWVLDFVVFIFMKPPSENSTVSLSIWFFLESTLLATRFLIGTSNSKLLNFSVFIISVIKFDCSKYVFEWPMQTLNIKILNRHFINIQIRNFTDRIYSINIALTYMCFKIYLTGVLNINP